MARFSCSDQPGIAMHGFSTDFVWSEWYGGGLIERNVLKIAYNLHKLHSFKPYVHRNVKKLYFLYQKKISTMLLPFWGEKIEGVCLWQFSQQQLTQRGNFPFWKRILKLYFLWMWVYYINCWSFYLYFFQIRINIFYIICFFFFLSIFETYSLYYDFSNDCMRIGKWRMGGRFQQFCGREGI